MESDIENKSISRGCIFGWTAANRLEEYMPPYRREQFQCAADVSFVKML